MTMKMTRFLRARLFGLAFLAVLAVSAAGCVAMEDEGFDQEAIGEEDQELRGEPVCESVGEDEAADQDCLGGSEDELGFCDAHANCYAFCRRLYPCNSNPSSCTKLADCLDGCDDSYPGCA
jgi:hypothetical protein